MNPLTLSLFVMATIVLAVVIVTITMEVVHGPNEAKQYFAIIDMIAIALFVMSIVGLFVVNNACQATPGHIINAPIGSYRIRALVSRRVDDVLVVSPTAPTKGWWERNHVYAVVCPRGIIGEESPLALGNLLIVEQISGIRVYRCHSDR